MRNGISENESMGNPRKGDNKYLCRFSLEPIQYLQDFQCFRSAVACCIIYAPLLMNNCFYPKRVYTRMYLDLKWNLYRDRFSFSTSLLFRIICILALESRKLWEFLSLGRILTLCSIMLVYNHALIVLLCSGRMF